MKHINNIPLDIPNNKVKLKLSPKLKALDAFNNKLNNTKNLEYNSWLTNFRNICKNDKSMAKTWFWDNIDLNTQSIWIGKFNTSNHLPQHNAQILSFIDYLINDLSKHEIISNTIYIKFYFTRNTRTQTPEINYLLISNDSKIPDEFTNTFTYIMFEKYQVTQNLINRDSDFKNLVNHYLEWNGFYTYYDLVGEKEF
jgi:hypothetical protein